MTMTDASAMEEGSPKTDGPGGDDVEVTIAQGSRGSDNRDESDEKEALLLDDDKSENKNETGGKNGNKRGEEEEEAMELPQSTHTLLFTVPVMSIPFLFSFSIAALSFTCLTLVLLNELTEGSKGNRLSVPAGVSNGVRVAQYLAIVVGLLMEEEIPQALILLRNISRPVFAASFSELSYVRFVASNLLRLVMGYLFLLNLFITIVQASDVLDIFFDILALQFVQQIDDVAFHLAMKDMLGRRLYRATTKLYLVDTNPAQDPATNPAQDPPEAAKQQAAAKRRCRTLGFRVLLRFVYFFNLAGLIFGVTFISQKQTQGDYLCSSITVAFGDRVWEQALIRNPPENNANKDNNANNETKPRTLVYSYFNGVYRMNGTHDGYPKYTEQNKLNGKEFLTTIGAEIKYCSDEEAWVFSHENIIKSGDSGESECAWLLRSPQTTEYDITQVSSDWSIWTGIIVNNHEVSIACDECSQESDCNYHGQCIESRCVCDDKFFGTHCQFQEPCESLIGDEGDTLSRSKSANGEPLMTYMRPVYELDEVLFTADNIFDYYDDATSTYYDDDINNNSSMTYDYNTTSSNANMTYYYDDESTITYDDDFFLGNKSFTIAIVYSGSRWFGTFEIADNGILTAYDAEYHAFWGELFEQRTVYVSDPDGRSTPVGVDFYEVAETGEDFGPFGLLIPLANVTGKGYFHCHDGTKNLDGGSNSSRRMLWDAMRLRNTDFRYNSML